MNFLAHFDLAGSSEGNIVGALLGDFIKGELRHSDLPTNIKAGVHLHRQIDAYTDQHIDLIALGRQLPDQLQRYKGVLTDLFFDYALCNCWHQFNDCDLTSYNEKILAVLDKHARHLNRAATDFVQRLRRYDLLCRYGNRDVINNVTDHIGRRLGREADLHRARDCMWQLEKEWLQAFQRIYPEIRHFAASNRR